MRYANEYDMQQWMRTFADPSTPNLLDLAVTLDNLREWANANSDGWAYWPKPCRSADRIIASLDAVMHAWRNGGFITDMTEAEHKWCLIPVKAFLTRQGVEHSRVIA